MPSTVLPLKRSSSSSSSASAPFAAAPEVQAKRLKQTTYRRRHRLVNPVVLVSPEPAIADNACVDQLTGRAISQSLRDCGFDMADPVALDAFRNAVDEYLTRFTSYVRQSMLSCRRLQPIPLDFELALKRFHLVLDDLTIDLQGLTRSSSTAYPAPALLPTPPPEDDDDAVVLWTHKTSLSFLGPELSAADGRARNKFVPLHFPAFPSKHTYCHTPVFPEREHDTRKIRERATEDGRHGEEALRKLACGASKNSQLGVLGREKKLWGRKMESLDTMFEKTIKGIVKKKTPKHPEPSTAMDIDVDATAAAAAAAAAAPAPAPAARTKSAFDLDLGPIVNCEMDFWRRTAASAHRKGTEKGPGFTEHSLVET